MQFDFLDKEDCKISEAGKGYDISNIQIVDIVNSDGHSLKPAQNVPYFVMPHVTADRPIDLNLGWEEHIFRYPELLSPMPHKIEHYFMTHMNSRKVDMQTRQLIHRIQFCFQSPTLKSLMTLPVSKFGKDKWQLYATKFRGKIFLCVKREPWFVNPQPTARDTYVFKFRQHVAADTPWGKPNTNEPVNEYQQTTAIYHANLGGLNLLYCAQLYGLMNKQKLTDLTDRRQLRSCRPVLPKLAPQCKNWRSNYRVSDWVNTAHLTGIKHVCVGFQERLRPGFISTPIRLFKPEYLAEAHSVKPSQLIPFVYKFLVKLQSVMERIDNPHTTFVFQWNEQKSKIVYEIHNGPNEYTFLNDEFIEFMDSQPN